MYTSQTPLCSSLISIPGKWLNIALLATLFNACATETKKIPDYSAAGLDSYVADINRVALVADLTPPAIESVQLGNTKEQAAAGGAVEGVLYGVITGPAFLLLWPVFVAGGTAAGAATGAASGYSAVMLAEAETNARNILESADLQQGLLEKVQAYGNEHLSVEFVRIPGADPQNLSDKPDYVFLSGKSIDAVIEVELIRLALRRRSAGRSDLIIDARIRLISTYMNKVLSDNQFKFASPSYTLDQWIADEAALLNAEIQRGLQRLAEDTVNENFLLFYPHKPESAGTRQADESGDDSQAAGMEITRWDMGSPHYVLSPMYADGLFYQSVKVDSLQPTLRWERFPRDHDPIDANGKVHDITDVRYELRVMSPQPIAQILYIRDIHDPYYTIESGLNACSRYLWTVRAAFKLDGHERVTEWAGAYTLHGWYRKPWNMRRGLYDDNAPERFYYVIITPCD